MTGYLVRRLTASLVSLVLVSIIVAALIRIVPGDAVLSRVAEAGDVTSPQQLAAVRHELGLDRPFYSQYFGWVGGIFQGDLGSSYSLHGVAVTHLLKEAYPVSLQLAIMAMLISLVIAIPIGVLSATRQDAWGDYLGRVLAVTGLSVPDFVLGTLLITYLTIWFNYTPPVHFEPFLHNPAANLRMTILPALILGLRFSSTSMRMIRSSMLEVLREDYVRTAWAKGLKQRVIIYRHVLKNASIPVVTVLGTLLAYLLAGAIIVETIFNLPGMGRLVLGGILDRDYPVVQAVVLVSATAMVLVNLAVDLSYRWLDPRIRYG